ncbi:MAG: hypothetical protein KGO02_14975 [Alphaproteobacteria bacterium]|nr:hypothetical protein [Alphaproteobacteria bacterium]
MTDPQLFSEVADGMRWSSEVATYDEACFASMSVCIDANADDAMKLSTSASRRGGGLHLRAD